MIVNNIGKVIGGKFVCPLPKYLVIQSGGIDLNVASDEVVHLYYSVFGDFESDGPSALFSKTALYFFGGKCK